MDAQVLGLGITLGTVIVGVTLYAAKGRATAETALTKARNVETAHTAYVTLADSVFARKETIGPQLDAMAKALERIEDRQDKLIDRLMGPVS